MIRFGVIGLGNRGSKFAVNSLISHPDIEVVCVCDENESHLTAFKERGIATFTRYSALLQHADLDAVFIATPDHTHADIIMEAIKYKKHILCEKPLDISLDKMQMVRDALIGYEKVFQVGYVLRYAPLFYKAKQIIENGIIGDVLLVNGTDHVNYGGYAFFHDWHRLKSKSYSLLLQKATHSLDILSWLIGSKPVKVAAFGGLEVFGEPGAIKKFGAPLQEKWHCRTCDYKWTCEESLINVKKNKGIEWQKDWPDDCVFDSEVNVDDHQALLIQYQNRAKVTYTLCQFASFYRREFQFFGTKGELYFDDEHNRIVVTDRLSQSKTIHEVKVLPGHSGGDDEMLKDFLHCIKTGESPRSNLESSYIVSELVIAAQKSIEEDKYMAIGG